VCICVFVCTADMSPTYLGTLCVSVCVYVYGGESVCVGECVCAVDTKKCYPVGRSVLQCVAVCCSVLQCVAVCCSVLQCVANVLCHK